MDDDVTVLLRATWRVLTWLRVPVADEDEVIRRWRALVAVVRGEP